ncbi:MAG: FtsX-like permease family protein [Candidatus Heimdallarchaeota archaeon]|nr:MAG: hypothetical protein DRP02_01485 [Candidatus Gerdarchaeota archaeon]RLI74508.1 MAG: hypothetical protein DRO91_00285 [Candidatus Heimdallarchaeota archaeon]
MGKISEHFKLNLNFMGSSGKYAVITILGLALSIAMVTQNVLFLDSFRNNAFNEFSSNISNTQIDTQLEDIRWSGMELKGILESAVTNEFEDAGLSSNLLATQEWVTYRFMFLRVFNEKTAEFEFHDTYLIGIDAAYLALLESVLEIGTAPGFNQYCLVTNSKVIEETNVGVNDTYHLYIALENNDPRESYDAGIGTAGQIIDFTGVINLDDITFGSLPIPVELKTLVSLVLNLGKELIITDFMNVPNLLSTITLSKNEFSVFGRILFDVTSFNVFKLDEQIANLQVYVNRLTESLINIVSDNSPNYRLQVNPYILPLLTAFKKEYRIFQTFLMLFMLPTLGMALTLTAFASNQIKKQRDLLVHNYYQRGSSRRMLFSFMLFELVIFAIIATLLGFLIGWPYTLIALKSDNFFSFASSASIPKPSWRIIGICLGVGFALAWFSNVFSLWRKTKTSVEEILQEQTEKIPFWQRFYFDILLLIIGVILWIVSLTQISGAGATAIEFAFYFAAPAPILIIIGAIMFITRIYPSVVQWVSKLMMKIHRLELSAVAAKNAVRRKASTTRTIILMTLTFTLTIATMIVPDSYQAYDLENSYYHLGADIVVQNVDIQNPTYKQTVEAIEGVEAATYVGFLEVANTESELLYSITILGVELDNFSKVAYQEPEYTNGQGIASLLQTITNESDVLGQRLQIEQLNLGENRTFLIKNWALSDTNSTEEDLYLAIYPVTITAFYEYWPLLYTEVPRAASREIKVGLIANLSLAYKIARNDYDIQGKLFVKVKDGYSPSAVAKEIELTTQHSTENIEDAVLISEGSLKATVLFGALNSSVIVSILISSATLIVMMFVQGLEREKEIALLKAFGIKQGQLFIFFITEAIIILIFTMLLGGALGFAASAMIMKILRIEVVVPIHEMVFPAGKILWTTFAIFFSGLISTIIPILINTHKKIGGSLKVV